MKATAENMMIWEQRITERIRKGMTIEEWCKKNGVSKHQYYYWNNRINKKRKTGDETAFADITPIISTTETADQKQISTSDFQVFLKNVRVIVPNDFDPVALTRLMKVLQEL